MAVDLSFYKSWLAEEIREEGRAQGRVQAGAKDILIVLEARGVNVPDEVRERVTACDDLELLDRWLVRAAIAASAEEIFREEDA
jgi:hypothetical protein